MNRTFKLIILTFLGLFSTSAFAGGSGQNGEEGHSRNGSASQLGDISSMIHKVAWYTDRDNSMRPVSSKKGVGAARVIFASKYSLTEGLQVAPGCFMVPAHGGNKDAIQDLKKGKGYALILHYPMNRENMIELYPSAAFSSPRLNGAHKSDFTSDYMFIKIDKPLRPNNYVRPVQASDKRLLEASSKGRFKSHLHRPLSLFNTNDAGVPDFNKDTWALKDGVRLKAVDPYRQAPQVVNQPCEHNSGYSGLIGSSCPNEDAVSGSPEIVNINGEDLLLGMHIHGLARSDRPFHGGRKNKGNGMLQSRHVCKDYESVCGQPCVNLEEVLPVLDKASSI